MTQEDKYLLLKDLCARLPYGVKCAVHDGTNIHRLSGVVYGEPYSELYFKELDWKECDGFEGVQYCKPYLFPLSSMTDEQYKVYHELISGMFETSALINFEVLEDFFHKNHFDYRGLIEKGLVLDATNLGIYK